MKLRPVPSTPTFVRARKLVLPLPAASHTSATDKVPRHKTISSAPKTLVDSDPARLSQQEIDAQLHAIIASAMACTSKTLLRLPAVCQKMGCGRSTVWKFVSDMVLTPPLYLGRSACWVNTDLEAIISARRVESLSHFEIDMKAFVAALIAPINNTMGNEHVNG